MKEHTAKSLVDIYDKLYGMRGEWKHPTKRSNGKPITIGRYGGPTTRNARFVNFIEANIPKEASVHDAGCGRGHLICKLGELGYNVSGSDCAPSLFFQELRDLPAQLVTYEDLRVFGQDRFNVVVSNDVLEHLVNEDAVDKAIADLAFIAKDWLLVSVGTKPAKNFPSVNRSLGIDDLHRVKRAGGWWRDRLNKHMEEIEHHRSRNNWFQFGRVRRS